jgi:hypothetical protein
MMMGFEPHDLHKSAQTIAVDVSDSVPAALRWRSRPCAHSPGDAFPC